jgi:hypothetical protein
VKSGHPGFALAARIGPYTYKNTTFTLAPKSATDRGFQFEWPHAEPEAAAEAGCRQARIGPAAWRNLKVFIGRRLLPGALHQILTSAWITHYPEEIPVLCSSMDQVAFSETCRRFKTVKGNVGHSTAIRSI